jgi:excinuclease ABC subunit C
LRRQDQREGYAGLVDDAKRFLEGKTTSVQADLARAWPKP